MIPSANRCPIVVGVAGAAAAGLTVSCAGWGELSASFGCAGAVDCRSTRATGFAETFALLAGFFRDAFLAGRFGESIFGVAGRADSFDTCAASVGSGFDVSAAGGAESVEARVDGGAAIGARSGLTVCGAANGAAGFVASAAGGAESVEARVDGAAAIGVRSGPTVCGAANGAAGIVASAAGGVESVEARVDGAVAIGAPSGPIACEATGIAPRPAGAGVNAGAARSKPEKAGAGAATSSFPRAGAEPLFAGAALGSGRVSRAPACKGATCRLPPVGEPEPLEGLGVRSFCGTPSAAGLESACAGGFGALIIRTRLAQIAAAPASASPAAVSFQRRELGLVDL